MNGETGYVLATLVLNTAMLGAFTLFAARVAHKKHTKPWLVAFWVGAAALSTVLNLIPFPFFYTFTALLYTLFFTALWLLFGLRWQNALYYDFLFYFATHWAVRAKSWTWEQLYGSVRSYPRAVDTLFSCLLALAAALAGAAVSQTLLRHSTAQRAYTLKTRELGNLLLLAVPLAYFCHMETLMQVDYLHLPWSMVLLRSIISLCAARALRGIVGEYAARETAAAERAAQQRLESRYQQLQTQQRSAELILQKCHDLKKQAAAFALDEGAAARYTAELDRTIQAYDSVYDTGNRVLDTLLTEESGKCRAADIQLICVLDGAAFSFLEPLDLCALFGNALDNAYESARQLPDAARRIIRVKSHRAGGLLYLKFENYCAHDVQRDADGRLLTEKPDRENHGFGVASIRSTVQKYGGSCAIATPPGMFTLTVLFPRGETE